MLARGIVMGNFLNIGGLIGVIEEVNYSIDGSAKATLNLSRLDGYSYTESFLDDISVSGTPNKLPKIKKVIFNPPATIVLWSDGSKTVVKCQNEAFDREKGLAMAVAKKALGNKGNYYNTFKKWLGV